MMPNIRKLSGFSAGFASICAATAAYLVQDRASKLNIAHVVPCFLNQMELQMIHHLTVIVGVVLFILSFFNFCHQVKLLFNIVLGSSFVSFVLMQYAFLSLCIAFLEQHMQADDPVFRCTNPRGVKNIMEADFELGISVMVLDLLAACCLYFALRGLDRYL